MGIGEDWGPTRGNGHRMDSQEPQCPFHGLTGEAWHSLAFLLFTASPLTLTKTACYNQWKIIPSKKALVQSQKTQGFVHTKFAA